MGRSNRSPAELPQFIRRRKLVLVRHALEPFLSEVELRASDLLLSFGCAIARHCAMCGADILASRALRCERVMASWRVIGLRSVVDSGTALHGSPAEVSPHSMPYG